MKKDDDDIKIFHPEKEDGASAELAELAELLDVYRKNGNMEKAARLGESLAERLDLQKIRPDGTAGLGEEELEQLRALILFSARLSLHKYLPHSMLASRAVNAMYAKIGRKAPRLFAKASEDSAFTFYYLSVRKNQDVERDVGRSFAMLCDRGGDENFVSIGKRAFSQTDLAVRAAVEEIGFKERPRRVPD